MEGNKKRERERDEREMVEKKKRGLKKYREHVTSSGRTAEDTQHDRYTSPRI